MNKNKPHPPASLSAVLLAGLAGDGSGEAEEGRRDGSLGELVRGIGGYGRDSLAPPKTLISTFYSCISEVFLESAFSSVKNPYISQPIYHISF